MDAKPKKHYHEDDFDAKVLLDTYFSNKSEKGLYKAAVKFPMEQLYKVFASGRIKGDSLIDVSFGPITFQLLIACMFFEDITVLKANELCIKELKQWINKELEAYDWSHVANIITDLEGYSDGWQIKEERLRKIINHILKCDFTKENPTDPVVLPKADCVLSAWALDAISKDKDMWLSNLKKMSSFLKLGGHLLLISDINLSFYIIGEHKFHYLKYDEDFLKKSLNDAGYVIDYYKVLEREEYTELLDYEKIVFLAARKEQEVLQKLTKYV